MPGKERGWFLMQARNWMFGLLASLFTLTAPLVANAADPIALSNGPGKTYLVSVGIGEFKDKAIHPRPTADTDAKALYKLLTDSKVLGVSPDRAKVLTSADATKESVVKAIESAITETGKDDLIILAFFGRGSAVAEKPCFFTPESSFKDRAKTALTTTDLEPAFKKLKGQKLLWLMDVSYKGVDAGKEKALEPTIAEYLKLAFDDADRDDNALPVNRVLVFGNLPFREALTKGEHGLFYSVLADALAGKADEKPFNTGYESDGLVTIYELAKYLEKEIPNGAREVGKTDKEKELIPFVIGAATSRFWVTRNAAETEKVAGRVGKIEALVKAGKLSAEDGKEGVALLTRMPKLKWQQDLRKEYQALACQPNSTNHFFFAEFASLCMNKGVEPDLWERLLPALVHTQELFFRAYRIPGKDRIRAGKVLGGKPSPTSLTPLCTLRRDREAFRNAHLTELEEVRWLYAVEIVDLSV
jgi:hypothetical protein